MGFLDEDEKGTVDEMAHGKPVTSEDDDIVLKAIHDATLRELNQEENKMAEVNERVERASEALKDAKLAYEKAGVPAQSEDIRSLAITFMIDEGKNGRMFTKPTPVKAVEQTEAPAPRQAPAQASGVVCALCGSDTYDNSVGKRNPKAPDYKCKKCEAVAWKSNTSKFFPKKVY